MLRANPEQSGDAKLKLSAGEPSGFLQDNLMKEAFVSQSAARIIRDILVKKNRGGIYFHTLSFLFNNLYLWIFLIWGLCLIRSPFLFAQVSETQSYILLNPVTGPADGITSCTAVVHIRGDTAPLSGKQATLQSSRGPSCDIISDSIGGSVNPQTTDSNGMCTFTIKSSYAGTTTITAICDSKTIQCSPAGTVLLFVRPVLNISKSMENMRTGETGTSVAVTLGDTIQYSIWLENAGNETASDVVIVDTEAFDTTVNNPVIFISMDTAPADTWAYTTVVNPLPSDWIAGTPLEGSTDVKGIRWKFNYLNVSVPEELKFRVRVWQ